MPVLELAIDQTSTVPPSEQVRAGIVSLIASGALAAGARLPTVRGLAEQLELAPNTIAKAFRQLEADEVIETRGRNGSFVSEHGDAIERQAQRAAREFADRIASLGVDADRAIALAKAALNG